MGPSTLVEETEFRIPFPIRTDKIAWSEKGAEEGEREGMSVALPGREGTEREGHRKREGGERKCMG